MAYDGPLSVGEFAAAHQRTITYPVPLETFLEYACWFQRRSAPDLDERMVELVEPAPGGFRLALQDGESFHAERVVVAAGIRDCAWRPPEYEPLAPELVSHSSDHTCFSRFAGRSVAVIGSGQSAVESAVLMREAGADVEIITRRSGIIWLRDKRPLRSRSALKPLEYLLYHPTDVGPPGLNWIVAQPEIFQRLPVRLQEAISYRSVRPAAAAWLQARAAGVRITPSVVVVSAETSGRQARVALGDGTSRRVDHVLLATGYKVDIARYTFLAPGLLERVTRAGGYPVLTRGMESSIRGLHFLGAPAAHSFGPLMRFVSGTWYSSSALAFALAGDSRRRAAA
jgi:cation diffusion facilitator CzcD-associated flavoprotein CzcO